MGEKKTYFCVDGPGRMPAVGDEWFVVRFETEGDICVEIRMGKQAARELAERVAQWNLGAPAAAQ